MATTPATDYENSGPSLDGILLAEELLDLAERAQAYTNAAGVAIALRRGQDLIVRTSTGSAPDVSSTIPATDGFIADCLRTRRPLCCRDTEADGRVGPVFRAMKIRSLIAVPICEHRDAKGVMIVVSPVANAFQPTHTAILMTLSDIIASKLAARDAMPKAVAEVAPAPHVQAAIADPAPAAYSRPAVPAMPPPVVPAAAANYSAPVPRQLEPMILPDHPAAAPHTASFASDSFPHISEVLGTPVTDLPMEATSIPADLLRTAPMPLPEEQHEEQADPGLLSPSEDPARFRRPISVSATTTQRMPVMSMNITPPAPTIKPAAPVMKKPAVPAQTMKPPAPTPKPMAPTAAHLAAAAAASASSAPATHVLKPMPVVKPMVKPAAVTPAAPVVEPLAVMPAPVIAMTPAADSWSSPVIEKQPKNKFLMFGSAAAALVVLAGLWMYMSATKEVTPPSAHAVQPAIATPAMPATAAAATTTPKLELVSKSSTSVEKSAEKPSKSVEVADVTKKIAPPVKVMELAAGKPRAPQAEVIDAPKLAMASGTDVVSTLSRLPVAMPSRPRSELVPATLVSRVAPTYPALAKQMHVYGMVQMSITIATSGAVKDVKVTSGPTQLQTAAIEAVKRWKYKPAMLNGEPTESAAEVQVNFSR